MTQNLKKKTTSPTLSHKVKGNEKWRALTALSLTFEKHVRPAVSDALDAEARALQAGTAFAWDSAAAAWFVALLRAQEHGMTARLVIYSDAEKHARRTAAELRRAGR